MRRSSYFRRTAGCVEGQSLSPPRLLFAFLPSAAEPAGIADMPQRDAIQQPIVEGKGPPVTAALETPLPLEPARMTETPQRDATEQPVVESKGPPVAAALEMPRQPQPIQTPSPETLSAPALQRKADPSASPPLSAQGSTRSSQPFQTDTQPPPATETPIQPRRLGVLEFEALETPKPIEAPPANAAAPEWLGRVGIPDASVSFPRSSIGARPSMDTMERTVASKRNIREPEHQPTTVPIWVEPPARDQDRNAAGNRVEHTRPAGGTVHIGSLEIKIAQLPPPPPPSQAASAVRRAPAVSSKPLSKEFPTFGIGQAY